MLTTVARTVVPVLGRLTVTTTASHPVEPGSIIAPNHTALVDPGVVLAALRRLGAERPVVLAAAGLWRIPVLGGFLRREGHIPVQRGSRHAAEALDRAAQALQRGRVVVIYAEGGLPRRPDSGEREPGTFRTGLARLAIATGAPVVPLGHAGARRITSGGPLKQIAGVVTAPLRRPALHVHLGEPLRLTGDVADATLRARTAVAEAWRTASRHLPAER